METQGRKDMRGWIYRAVVVVILLLPGISHALTIEQRPLVGLQGVYVKVMSETKTKDAEIERLAGEMQTDVELRLRKAGIRVLTEKESTVTRGYPWLFVNVLALDGPLLVFSVRVEVMENATLARGNNASVISWSTHGAGSIGRGNIREIRESVSDLVDKFINDYLAANPKK